MATPILEEIPGSISSAELFSQAVATGKKVKYYLVSRSMGNPIRIRYVTPVGSVTDGHGRKFSGFNKSVKRFQNYWHAYAYQLRLKAAKED